MTSATTTVRRSSYGPTSPNVGERGGQTRDAILAAAKQRFAVHGYHDTSVRDIAEAASISRATLYQYFANKHEIFREIMNDCARALLRALSTVGPLGRSDQGFANLGLWLDEWSRIYQQYATLFAQWRDVDLPATPSGTLVATF